MCSENNERVLNACKQCLNKSHLYYYMNKMQAIIDNEILPNIEVYLQGKPDLINQKSIDLNQSLVDMASVMGQLLVLFKQQTLFNGILASGVPFEQAVIYEYNIDQKYEFIQSIVNIRPLRPMVQSDLHVITQ